jgi:hypothetical protein
MWLTLSSSTSLFQVPYGFFKKLVIMVMFPNDNSWQQLPRNYCKVCYSFQIQDINDFYYLRSYFSIFLIILEISFKCNIKGFLN